MKLKYEDVNVIKDVPPVTSKNDYVVIDVELFGAEEKLLHRPTTGKFACITMTTSEDTCYLLQMKKCYRVL